MGDNESLDRALERLLSDQSPRFEAQHLDEEERDMLRLAQVLRGSRGGEPAPQFVEQLHEQLFPAGKRVSRRTAFVSGLGALAAGLLGGLGIERAIEGNGSSSSRESATRFPLVRLGRGKWVHVANTAELPVGAVQPFTAGAVQGFLINDHGDLRAMSSICTHMGCALRFEAEKDERYFECPCHGAEFSLSGKLRYGAGGYRHLPPLPGIQVRVRGEKVEVYGA